VKRIYWYKGIADQMQAMFLVFLLLINGGLGRFLHDPTPDLVNKAEQVHKEGKKSSEAKVWRRFSGVGRAA
jgi:hypothetical protein